MSAPIKKREVQSNNDAKEKYNAENIIEDQEMKIQADFEGRSPQDPDYHGIKTLLQQLFLKDHIDLGGLTDYIIGQNYVGTVIKQYDDEEDSDDEDTDINDVFGVTSVINVSEKKDLLFIQQLRTLLKDMAIDHASDETNRMIDHILENNDVTLGLIINQRFVNIPAQISVPLLEHLSSEIKRANDKGKPFAFTHYILICKFYKTNEIFGKRNKNHNETDEIIWSNPEEEIFAEEAEWSFEFSVEKDSDNALGGSWTETDCEMTPYKRVLIFKADKLSPIINKIKNHVS